MSEVFYSPTDDPDMAAAMERARASFKYLWRELTWEYRRIIPGVELAAVKLPFADPGSGPDDVEHMWCTDIEFDGDVIRATLINEPNHLRSVQNGDFVERSLEELEDWMYVMRGRVYGGFTVNALRARMSAGERRRHDGAWGFDFGDPTVIELVPNWGAPAPRQPGVLGRLFGKKAEPPPLGDPDAEHPMSENMAEKLGESIEQDRAAFLTDTDPDGLNTLHSLALGGSAAGVRILLEHGADPFAKTKSGKTARDLAERVGWPRVVELLAAAERH